MKKILLALTAIFILFSISANAQSKSGKSDKARKNIETCNMINKAIMSGDMNMLDNAIAKDAVDHAGMHGDVMGLDSIKSELGKFHSMVPDMKFEVIREVADDEYVFQWMRFTGTTATADMGMPAGTKMDMTAVEVSKMKDGKAVEHWEFMQPSDMMKMMSQSPGMGAEKQDSGMQK
jgi:predicted ester cyclase